MAETDSSEAERALADRYGRVGRRRAPRWAYPVLTAVVALAGLALAVILFRNLGSPPIEGKQVAYRVLDEGAVEVGFEVVRDHPDRAAMCIVRTRSQDGDEAGRREVLVPPGTDRTVLNAVVRTSKRPVTGEVFGCSYQVPAYLSSEPRPNR
ncbi:DUF4307 domain-containing protein [Streptoalloteichus hindustanus]|uniref:DUF4307 domain-containing protein n=1 Tax=Streptoalloteichus hindustanus TaxID=2017 RepID=A0A1M5KRN6_STRHI|nr:DUF4307 domain-containing protein [Streptoalloteichus hindustanus]SHG54833.1 protein of unknown function [Streptoalloteichus hindustanus]